MSESSDCSVAAASSAYLDDACSLLSRPVSNRCQIPPQRWRPTALHLGACSAPADASPAPTTSQPAQQQQPQMPCSFKRLRIEVCDMRNGSDCAAAGCPSPCEGAVVAVDGISPGCSCGTNVAVFSTPVTSPLASRPLLENGEDALAILASPPLVGGGPSGPAAQAWARAQLQRLQLPASPTPQRRNVRRCLSRAILTERFGAVPALASAAPHNQQQQQLRASIEAWVRRMEEDAEERRALELPTPIGRLSGFPGGALLSNSGDAAALLPAPAFSALHAEVATAL